MTVALTWAGIGAVVAALLVLGTRACRRDPEFRDRLEYRDTTEVPPGQDPFITRQQKGEHK